MNSRENNRVTRRLAYDMVGSSYGQLHVLGAVVEDVRRPMLDVECSCGTRFRARAQSLRRGYASACRDCRVAAVEVVA